MKFKIFLLVIFILGSYTTLSEEWKILKQFDGFWLYDLNSYDSSNYVISGRFSDKINNVPTAYSYINLSTDAGKSWNIIWKSNMDLSKFENDRQSSYVEFLTENTLISGVSGGYIIRTTDQGKNWDTTDFNLDIEDHCSALDFYESKYGVAGYESSTFIIITNDSGKTWEKMKKPEIGLNSLTYNIDDLAILNDSTIIMSYYRYENDTHWIIRTENNGKTWSYYIESDNYHTKFYFYDDKVGYMGGAIALDDDGSSLIKKTTDGGLSWFICYEDSHNPKIGAILDMFIFDKENVVALNASEILRTTDGGDSWFNEFYEPPPINARLQDVSFGDEEYGLLITTHNYIYTNNNQLIDNVERIRNTEQNLNICPNPAYNKIYINNAGIFTKYQIINNFGEIVKEGAGINDWIDVSDLPAGMYVVRIFNNRKKEYKSIKFIKY